MTSLTESLVGPGTMHDIVYEKESVHNLPAIAWNAIVFTASKVKDNTLQVMTAPAIMP